jgi:dienelactone hydrolase
MSLDPESFRVGYAAAKRADFDTGWYARFGGGTPDAHAVTEWQGELRELVSALLGGLSEWETVPTDPRVVATVELDGYRRETVTFATRPGLTAFGYYLVPDGCPPGQPAVLCLPGHGRGVDVIVGIAEDGTQRTLGRPDEYANDFALQCVAEGYPVFALEQISFGHRRDARARAAGPGASSCVRDSMAALMAGECMVGWRVWDALRAVDYLQTRAEVDPAGIYVMGISGGGTVALFSAALDTRIAGAVVSGYLNTFPGSILAVDHCVDNFVPDLLTYCDMPDVAALIAPRVLFAESGRDDPIFPLPTFEAAVAQLREVYAALDAAPNFGSEVFDAGHVFHGAGAFRFLREVNRGR